MRFLLRSTLILLGTALVLISGVQLSDAEVQMQRERADGPWRGQAG